MSLELRDFRGKITVESDIALEAEARAFRRDKTDIVREILHAWALKKIMSANVLQRRIKAEGLARVSSGYQVVNEGIDDVEE